MNHGPSLGLWPARIAIFVSTFSMESQAWRATMLFCPHTIRLSLFRADRTRLVRPSNRMSLRQCPRPRTDGHVQHHPHLVSSPTGTNHATEPDSGR